MSKEEIIKTIRECAEKLGRSPSLPELRRLGGVTETRITQHFGNMTNALEESGLKAAGPGFEVRVPALLLDWARVARKLGKLPTKEEYEKEGQYSATPFYRNFKRWKKIAESFGNFAKKEKIRGQWLDVLGMLSGKEKQTKYPRRKRTRRGPLLPDRPVYGSPMLLPELAHEPVNEMGVLYVFGMLARFLGFVVHRLQPEFPDCEAMREMAKGQWQRVRIEFEFESRNFLIHRHAPEDCDLIVCWVHNWPECPVQVLELKKVVQTIAAMARDRETPTFKGETRGGERAR